MDFLLIGAGLVGLLLGGEMLVRGAVGVAARLGLPPMVIGLTLVGFGTSTPELLTSVQAALAGAPGIALGNVVGSNTANILLILGVAALLLPVAVTPGAFRRDGTALALATALCVAATMTGTIGRAWGLALVAGLALFLVTTLRSARADPDAPAEDLPGLRAPLAVSVVLSVAGLAVTIVGAKLLVDGAVSVARDFGVSEALIGVTVVAIGTSLPELATTLVAARRGQNDVAFGNVIGSNIFNVLGILGITALVSPLVVAPEIAALDIWVMTAATVALIAVAVTGWRITRVEGAALLVGLRGLHRVAREYPVMSRSTELRRGVRDAAVRHWSSNQLGRGWSPRSTISVRTPSSNCLSSSQSLWPSIRSIAIAPSLTAS